MSDEQEEQNRKKRQDEEAARARQQASQGGVAGDPTPDKPEVDEGETEENVLSDEKKKEEKKENEDDGKNDYVGSQMAQMNASKKNALENAKLAKEEEEEEKEREAAAAEEERKKTAEEAALQALEAEREEEKEKTVEHNELLGELHLAEEKLNEAERKLAVEKKENPEGPFAKLQEDLNVRAEKVSELQRAVAFEERRAEHIELREEVNEETGKTFFEEHQKKAQGEKGFLKDISEGNKEGESPIEAMRRRKAEKLAAKKTKEETFKEASVPSPEEGTARNQDEQATADQYEKHANVMTELKAKVPVRDDANREMEEAFGATTVGVDQKAKTNRVADTPEEAKEQGLNNSSAANNPAAMLAESRAMHRYAQAQEKRQEQQKTSTPTPEPGHGTAPNPKDRR
jgi:hypothetical protein